MELKPRKITVEEIASRLLLGIIRTEQLLEFPQIVDTLIELKKESKKSTRASIDLLLLEGFIDTHRIAESVFTNKDDTMSYSNILECICDLKKTCPPDVYKEMDEAGIIDDFYSEACVYCDSYDDCHKRPYKRN